MKQNKTLNGDEYIIYTDGGSRGNPGPAAYGFVIYKNGELLFEEGKRIGEATNNVAEYTAVIAALKYVLSSKYPFGVAQGKQALSIQFFMDSKLVAEQLSGRWKVKNETLRNLYFTIKELEQKIGTEIVYEHVGRAKNLEADRLVNFALDSEL